MRALALLVALVAATLALGAACGGGEDEPTPVPTSAVEATPSSADLARSVVQVVALDDTRSSVWTGSGTVISSEGLILTNAHVVDDRFDEYAVLGVAVTDRTDQPPEPSFLAEIAAADYVLDLAVIRIVSDLDGEAVEVDLPSVGFGDSAAVEIGDDIRILGYPSIGGETITFTTGVVSGFSVQREIADRAWIKTDATISGGNSGGLAVNDKGELIGVPTVVGSGSETAEFVDCRYVVDTNRDGVVDELDNCLPVGGFINGLRPLALALPLIDAAESGTTYVSAFAQPDPVENFDPADIFFDNLIFSDGVTANDEPTQVVPFLPSGAGEVCAFWDYEGMLDGVRWEALWFVDGQLDEAGSIIDETWIGGETGNYWVCNFDDRGLPDGLYELVLSVEGEFQASDAIYLGGDHPLVEVDIDNASNSPICFALLSPNEAENWGQDELGGDEIVGPGTSTTLFVAAGVYDLLLLDCDLNELAMEFGLDITEGGTYTLQ